jgi:hypothetical protein
MITATLLRKKRKNENTQPHRIRIRILLREWQRTKDTGAGQCGCIPATANDYRSKNIGNKMKATAKVFDSFKGLKRLG